MISIEAPIEVDGEEVARIVVEIGNDTAWVQLNGESGGRHGYAHDPKAFKPVITALQNALKKQPKFAEDLKHFEDEARTHRPERPLRLRFTS